MNDELIFDLETQKAFSDLDDRRNTAGLGVSVLGCYSYATGEFRIFLESELSQFEELLAGARRVIGYNIRHFDYQVLQPYMRSLNLSNLPTLDLILEPATHLNFRPKLDDLAKATLGMSKSGHGLEAIRWFREGNLGRLKEYCLDDVKLTKGLYEHGRDKGEILIEPRYGGGLRKVPVNWQEPQPMAISQKSLF